MSLAENLRRAVAVPGAVWNASCAVRETELALLLKILVHVYEPKIVKL